MKTYLIIVLSLSFAFSAIGQKNRTDNATTLSDTTSTISSQWTQNQISKANTAKDVTCLTKTEKEAILYINLARLYPKDFVKIELTSYFGTTKYGNYLKKSEYRKSLISNLNGAKASNALDFDNQLYDNAKCFSKELGESGREGHERKICKEGYRKYAECLSFGMETGKDIAMQWLIDDKVSSLGHREICLDNTYSKIAISTYPHKKWDTCAVAELQ